MNQPTSQHTYSELTQQNPCNGCPAPCCRMQIHACLPPSTLMNIDHIRYSLLFPNTELTIARGGEFSYIRWETCSQFDEKECTCKLHNTSQKPLTCLHYNPHNCWYKRNFTTATAEDLCRFDSQRFEQWVAKVGFDEEGKVIDAPDFEETKALAQAHQIQPLFKLDSELRKGSLQTT
ncbi:MAG: hypothetical protein Q3M30_16270 [Candidatus Electrothrix sp. Rat3]|nr:hypothetical protein [Candidatus Electrothrix rattekaaiensis]